MEKLGVKIDNCALFYLDSSLFSRYTTQMPLFSRVSPERIEAYIHHFYNHVLFVYMPGFPLKKLAVSPWSSATILPQKLWSFWPKFSPYKLTSIRKPCALEIYLFFKLWEWKSNKMFKYFPSFAVLDHNKAIKFVAIIDCHHEQC